MEQSSHPIPSATSVSSPVFQSQNNGTSTSVLQPWMKAPMQVSPCKRYPLGEQRGPAPVSMARAGCTQRADGWAALSFPFSFQTFAHTSVTGISHQCIWSCSALHVVGRWVVARMEGPQQGGPVLTPVPALSSCFSEFHISLPRLPLHPYHHQLSPLLEKQPKAVASCQPWVAFPEVCKFQEDTLEAGLTSK